MGNLKILRFFVLIGIAIHFYSGSTVFSIQNGFMHLEMDSFSLFAYPFFVFAVWYSFRQSRQSSEETAAWWRGFVAFIVDFTSILSLIGIPLCLFALMIENNGYPEIWFIARELNSNENLFYSLFLFPSILLMIASLGLCLHPRIVSPGAFLTNISIETKIEMPIGKLVVFGFLSYFLIAFPFFRHFMILQKDKEKKRLEPVVVLRNA